MSLLIDGGEVVGDYCLLDRTYVYVVRPRPPTPGPITLGHIWKLQEAFGVDTLGELAERLTDCSEEDVFTCVGVWLGLDRWELALVPLEELHLYATSFAKAMVEAFTPRTVQ